MNRKSFYFIISLSLLAGVIGWLPNPGASCADAQALVIDHTSVEEFHRIPEYWIEQAKQLLIQVVGESHSSQVKGGLNLVEGSHPQFSQVQFGNLAFPPSEVGALRVLTVMHVSSGGRQGYVGEQHYWSNENARTNMSEYTMQYADSLGLTRMARNE